MARDKDIANRLRAAGLSVVEIDGWQKRGSLSFNPRGGVDHHTAGSNNGNAPSLGVCINGRAGLPGPLCNVLQGFDGTCYVIASGRANHAGQGGWEGLSGNSSVYGMERENDGHSSQRPGQQEAAERAWAAILKDGPFGTIDPSMLCGHLEWAPRRKVDFHGVNYVAMRAEVKAFMYPSAPTDPQGDVVMFCLVQPPGKDAGVYRFNGSGMIGVPNGEMLKGDQILLGALGLNTQIAHVTQEYFDSWPMIRP